MSGSLHFRAHQRAGVRLRGHLATEQAQDVVRIVDLGLGGAQVRGSWLPPVDARVELSIEFPDRWLPVTFRGRIAWRGSSETPGRAVAGVAWTDLKEADLLPLLETLLRPKE